MLSLNELDSNNEEPKNFLVGPAPVTTDPELEMKKTVSGGNSMFSRSSLPKNYFKRTGSSSRLTGSHGSSSSLHPSVDENSKGKAGDAVQPRSDYRRISTEDVKRRWRARQIAKQVSPPPKRQSFLCWLRKLSPKSSDVVGRVLTHRRESQRETHTHRVVRVSFLL